jgi:hypothetical protein
MATKHGSKLRMDCDTNLRAKNVTNLEKNSSTFSFFNNKQCDESMPKSARKLGTECKNVTQFKTSIFGVSFDVDKPAAKF